jgi:hypothetical protein
LGKGRAGTRGAAVGVAGCEGVVVEEEEKEDGGQDWTHCPLEAKREPEQEVKVEVPALVAQDPSQAGQKKA